MSKVRKILAILENLAFFVFCMVLILFLVQLFCFTSFKIPSDSMEPVLKDGDRILVNKMIKGARLFNVFAALDNEDFTIHRMPGWGNFKRNDILVFNFPYQQNRWDSIRMDVMQYYVKRCIALPGDTLEIRGGFYKIRGCNEQVGIIRLNSILQICSIRSSTGLSLAHFHITNSLSGIFVNSDHCLFHRKDKW